MFFSKKIHREKNTPKNIDLNLTFTVLNNYSFGARYIFDVGANV